MTNRLIPALLLSALAMGASVAAQAADSVTLYGILDVGVGGTQQSYRHSSVGMLSGVQSGSRWGLRGSERLDNGLHVNFRLESGFNATNGKLGQGGRLFGRTAWVGLSGGFGDVRFGRQSTASADVFEFIDPFGTGFNQASMGSSFSGGSSNRSDSTLYYRSPQWGNVVGYVSYTFNRDGGAATSRESDQLLSGGLKYVNGPLSLAATYEGAYLGSQTAWAQRMRALDPQGRVRDPYNVQFGGTWTQGIFTASAAWSYMKNGFTNPGMGDDYGVTGAAIGVGTVRDFPGQHVNAYLLGLAAKLDPATRLFGSWQMTDPSRQMFGQTAHRQQIYSLGATYNLSPRTNLYAFYSYTDGAWFDRRWHSQNYGVGMRHHF